MKSLQHGNPCAATENNSFISNLVPSLLLSFSLLVRRARRARARHCYLHLPRMLNGFRKRAPINKLPPSPDRPTDPKTDESINPFSGSLNRYLLFLEKPMLNKDPTVHVSHRYTRKTRSRRCHAPSIESLVQHLLKRSNQEMSGAPLVLFSFLGSPRDTVGGQRRGELAI